MWKFNNLVLGLLHITSSLKTIFSHWTVNPSLFLDSPTPDSMNYAPAFPACKFLYLHGLILSYSDLNNTDNTETRNVNEKCKELKNENEKI